MLTIFTLAARSSDLNWETFQAHEHVRVLVVDDDVAVLGMVAAMLKRAGYTVRTARNAQEAIARVRNAPEEIDLLLTDVIMPGIDGLRLADNVRTILPDLPILLMAGFPDIPTRYGPLIAKPFKPSALVLMIDSLVSSRRKGPRREERAGTEPGTAQSA